MPKKEGPLAPYWKAFIFDILKYSAFIPIIMSSNLFGWLIGACIILADVYALYYSLTKQRRFDLAIMAIVEYWATGGK